MLNKVSYIILINLMFNNSTFSSNRLEGPEDANRKRLPSISEHLESHLSSASVPDEQKLKRINWYHDPENKVSYPICQIFTQQGDIQKIIDEHYIDRKQVFPNQIKQVGWYHDDQAHYSYRLEKIYFLDEEQKEVTVLDQQQNKNQSYPYTETNRTRIVDTSQRQVKKEEIKPDSMAPLVRQKASHRSRYFDSFDSFDSFDIAPVYEDIIWQRADQSTFSDRITVGIEKRQQIDWRHNLQSHVSYPIYRVDLEQGEQITTTTARLTDNG